MTKAFSGRDSAELTPDRLADDELDADDVRIHPDTLEAQAQVAEANLNPQLAANLRRAAELALLSEAEVMALYEALRPHRSTAERAGRARDHARRDARPADRGAGPRGRSGVRAARPAQVTSSPQVVAAIDVGNATTEVLLARVSPGARSRCWPPDAARPGVPRDRRRASPAPPRSCADSSGSTACG